MEGNEVRAQESGGVAGSDMHVNSSLPGNQFGGYWSDPGEREITPCPDLGAWHKPALDKSAQRPEAAQVYPVREDLSFVLLSAPLSIVRLLPASSSSSITLLVIFLPFSSFSASCSLCCLP